MKPLPGPVYEVTLCVDRELGEELDAWLTEHVEEMLEVPGFVSADTCTLETEDDKAGRVTRYNIESDALLERYLDGEAAIKRQSGIDRFGDRMVASRRVLRSAESVAEPPQCLNCDTVLNGQYCGQCGQRAASRLISIWELVRDAFGDLFEFDSRLWRTLIPLAVRPGLLTRDYLQGRRARYMPPFRMYIVLSLVFFLVAFFNPRETLGILFPAEAPEVSQADNGAARVAAEIRNELEDPEDIFEPDEDGLTLTINGDGDGADATGRCELEAYDANSMPPWLARRFTKERVQDVCNRLIAEDGAGIRGFLDKLRDSAPIGLFVLLPLMALILKILYPLSKRYYVEHLLFVVHYHAFIFLALIVQILFARSLSLLGLPNAFNEMAGIAISIYIPVYLYKALRRVYAQGRWLTLWKLLLLSLGYGAGLLLILIFAVLFAAFSV